MESRQDVFHPAHGVFRFPLVRQEDAPFFEVFFVRPAPRGWYQEFEFIDSDSENSRITNFQFKTGFIVLSLYSPISQTVLPLFPYCRVIRGKDWGRKYSLNL